MALQQLLLGLGRLLQTAVRLARLPQLRLESVHFVGCGVNDEVVLFYSAAVLFVLVAGAAKGHLGDGFQVGHRVDSLSDVGNDDFIFVFDLLSSGENRVFSSKDIDYLANLVSIVFVSLLTKPTSKQCLKC